MVIDVSLRELSFRSLRARAMIFCRECIPEVIFTNLHKINLIYAGRRKSVFLTLLTKDGPQKKLLTTCLRLFLIMQHSS